MPSEGLKISSGAPGCGDHTLRECGPEGLALRGRNEWAVKMTAGIGLGQCFNDTQYMAPAQFSRQTVHAGRSGVSLVLQLQQAPELRTPLWLGRRQQDPKATEA